MTGSYPFYAFGNFSQTAWKLKIVRLSFVMMLSVNGFIARFVETDFT